MNSIPGRPVENRCSHVPRRPLTLLPRGPWQPREPRRPARPCHAAAAQSWTHAYVGQTFLLLLDHDTRKSLLSAPQNETYDCFTRNWPLKHRTLAPPRAVHRVLTWWRRLQAVQGRVTSLHVCAEGAIECSGGTVNDNIKTLKIHVYQIWPSKHR